MTVILHDPGDGVGTSIGTPLLQRGSRPEGRRDDKRNVQPEAIRRHFPTESFVDVATALQVAWTAAGVFRQAPSRLSTGGFRRPAMRSIRKVLS